MSARRAPAEVNALTAQVRTMRIVTYADRTAATRMAMPSTAKNIGATFIQMPKVKPIAGLGTVDLANKALNDLATANNYQEYLAALRLLAKAMEDMGAGDSSMSACMDEERQRVKAKVDNAAQILDSYFTVGALSRFDPVDINLLDSASLYEEAERFVRAVDAKESSNARRDGAGPSSLGRERSFGNDETEEDRYAKWQFESRRCDLPPKEKGDADQSEELLDEDEAAAEKREDDLEKGKEERFKAEEKPRMPDRGKLDLKPLRPPNRTKQRAAAQKRMFDPKAGPQGVVLPPKYYDDVTYDDDDDDSSDDDGGGE